MLLRRTLSRFQCDVISCPATSPEREGEPLARMAARIDGWFFGAQTLCRRHADGHFSALEAECFGGRA